LGRKNFLGCVPPASTAISEADYERKADQSLDNLSDYLDTFPEWLNCDDEFDINYAMGVITANVGQGKGIYVINKQTPNRQIWLSSPLSGPKRSPVLSAEAHYRAQADTYLTGKMTMWFTSCLH
uniref:Frataxin, mitochondrial (inferred by orthology to a C. elegans protein) n=1 Tax=Anisakis simplex TaxID=6269 RepID=A0A0M3JE50_ANISI